MNDCIWPGYALSVRGAADGQTGIAPPWARLCVIPDSLSDLTAKRIPISNCCTCFAASAAHVKIRVPGPASLGSASTASL